MKRGLIVCLMLLSAVLSAQEVLLPLVATVPERSLQSKQDEPILELPFFDDFAQGALAADKWQHGSGCTVANYMQPLPPTVGAVMFDALSSTGKLYPQATTTVFGADTLCSHPIRLDTYSVADSLVLSFHYLPGGGGLHPWERVGDAPDDADSLVLEFYRVEDSTWATVWATSGISTDSLLQTTGSAWQRVHVPLADPAYYDSLFRFRFRSYASLEQSPKAGWSGNGDYWYVDYVMLDAHRSVDEPLTYRDVAFAGPAPSVLNAYRTVPYNHYSAEAMASQMNLSIANLGATVLASHYGYSVFDAEGTRIAQYDGGFENVESYWAEGQYQTADAHAHPPIDFVFPTMSSPTSFDIVHTVREGTQGDAYPANDTVCYRQRFDCYYAYDDGVPENGYGLTTTASQLWLAYQFDLATTDTLTAVDLFFNHTLDSANATIPFYITIWSDEGGYPGRVLYRDQSRRFAQTGGFSRYVLEHTIVVGGRIYVGFEQTGNNFINIGFDRSFNTSERIFYLTGTEWQRSILSGSLMLRPCFGTIATIGVEPSPMMPVEVTLYPNPANDRVRIEGMPQEASWYLYDNQGRCVGRGTSSLLQVASLRQGVYLLRIVSSRGVAVVKKIVIQH